MARTSTKRSVGSFLVLLMVVLCNLMASNTTPVSGRYLPTRGDDTEIEVLKDLIRGLLTRSKLQADQSAAELAGSSRMGQWRPGSHTQAMEVIQRRSAMAAGGEEAPSKTGGAFYGNYPARGDDR